MSGLPQHVYASNLIQDHGYPLRNPTPNATIPPEAVEGLDIGDVGFVDNYGCFNLVFNIKFPPKELQDEIRKHSIDFIQPLPQPAIDPDTVLTTGVKRNPEDTSADFVFTTTSKAGAILLLPDGATLFELQDKQQLHILQKLATKCALQWCRHKNLDSLYLITALYKSRHWTLGSFSDKSSPENIFVDCHRPSDAAGGFVYRWRYETNVDHKQCPGKNRYLNQTVFIKGFKMTVRWDRLPVVAPAERLKWWLSHFFTTLWLTMSSWWWLSRISIQYIPTTTSNFSQPHHPLDVINRVLLEKNPGAQVAVTHDDDWIGMHERGLPLESLMQEDHIRNFVANEHMWHFDSESQHNTVYLRNNFEGARSRRKQARSIKDISTLSLRDSPRFAIIHMRLENIEVDHIDAGVCVLIQFGKTTRRTMSKPHASIVEWDNEVNLPVNLPVSFTVCTVFQLGSSLGTREISTKQTITTKTLFGGAHMIRLSVGKADSSSSLLITLGKHFSDLGPCSSRDETKSPFTQNTGFGFKFFFSFQHDPKEEHLEGARKYFQLAVENCGSNDPDCATALFNLATTEFIMYQVQGTYSKLSIPIERYEKALELRNSRHQDRPATLLLLAQALLSCLGQEYDESIAALIKRLLTQVRLEDCRERRTADAIIRTCRFYQVINSKNPVEVNGLLKNMNRGAYVPPYGFFDRPHMLHKLGMALWARFRHDSKLDDLDKSIALNEEALSLIPEGHDDRMSIGACIRNSVLLKRIEAGEELKVLDVDEALDDATKLKFPKFDIFHTICDLLERQGRVTEAIVCFKHVWNRLDEDTSSNDERVRWKLDFQRHCRGRLDKLVDVAMDLGNFGEAADHLSAILSLDPVDRVDVLIKRSEARAMMSSWDEALNDADEAIKLHPSSYQAYQIRHAALHGAGRRADAVIALNTILSELDGSPDEVLSVANKFKLAKFHIFCGICDVLEGNDRVVDAILYFRLMESELQEEEEEEERAQWELDFQRRCRKRLDKLVDVAMDLGNFGEAADHLSAILSLDPVDRVDILIKRSEARAMMSSWDEVLNDANEAINLHLLLFRGHEMRHVALHGLDRYAEALEALDVILSELGGSPDGALAAATQFKLAKFPVFRAICEVLERNDRTPDAMLYFQRMKMEVKERTNPQWEEDFQRRCREKLGKTVDAPTSTSKTPRASHKTRHVVFIGETGAGKSSVINLFTGRRCAPTSNDAAPCTRDFAPYEATVEGKPYMLWDTPGLNESGEIFRRSTKLESLKKFIRERYRLGELDLLVFCFSGSTAYSYEFLSKAYKAFGEPTRRIGIPVVIVLTHLEKYQSTMDAWWDNNERHLRELGLEFDNHACVTCLQTHHRRWASQQEIRLVISRKYHRVSSPYEEEYLDNRNCVVC